MYFVGQQIFCLLLLIHTLINMKNGLALIALIFCVLRIDARSFDNKNLGLRFELPATWDSVAII